MDPDKIETIVLSFPVLLLAFCVHEFMHAWVALKQGDDTAYMLGRVTLDPRAHIDPIGSILFPLVGALTGAPIIGWAKPTPTNPRKYRNYKRGDILVSIAGVVGNLGLAVLFTLLHVVVLLTVRGTGPTAFLVTADQVCAIGVFLNVMLIFFNLIPVPPLDGSHVLYHLLPANLAHAYRQLFPYGMFILYALLFVKALNPMWELAGTITRAFLSVGNLVG
ncbi:MAG TPA: site-2 protease family protein [Longimicrobium sp.]|jgi:Zn-dependent protease|nr:site-2 protease family protein [Longimicrobium sp.]